MSSTCAGCIAKDEEISRLKAERDDALVELTEAELAFRQYCECCDGTGKYDGEPCPECNEEAAYEHMVKQRETKETTG